MQNKKPSLCALLSIKVGQRWCCNAQHCACLMQMVSSYVDAIKIKENALPDLVAPFEVEAPTSSQFQQASPVALELERQEEEELGEYTSYYMPLTFSLLFV
eukprot:Em0012g348a